MNINSDKDVNMIDKIEKDAARIVNMQYDGTNIYAYKGYELEDYIRGTLPQASYSRIPSILRGMFAFLRCFTARAMMDKSFDRQKTIDCVIWLFKLSNHPYEYYNKSDYTINHSLAYLLKDIIESELPHSTPVCSLLATLSRTLGKESLEYYYNNIDVY